MRHTTILVGLLIGLALLACGGGEPTSPGDEKASISFLRTRSPGFADLFVVAASGAVLTQLFDSSRVRTNRFQRYEWSPDGDKVAFAYIEGAGFYQLRVMDATGGALTYVSDLNTHLTPLRQSFSWSPDQSRLALTNRSKVSVVNPDGSGLHDIVDSSGVRFFEPFWGAQWSPDGTQIAFYGEGLSLIAGPLQLINPGGDGHVILPTGDAWAPDWSPDGTRLAFLRFSDSPQPKVQIYIINRDGSELVEVTDASLRIGWLSGWSPDGSRLVFVAATYSEPCGEGSCDWHDVMVVNADGSGLAQLTDNQAVEDYDPVWSPDGSRIAFVSDRDGNLEVYVMNPDGSDLFNLTQNPADDYAPRWVPRPRG